MRETQDSGSAQRHSRLYRPTAAQWQSVTQWCLEPSADLIVAESPKTRQREGIPQRQQTALCLNCLTVEHDITHANQQPRSSAALRGAVGRRPRGEVPQSGVGGNREGTTDRKSGVRWRRNDFTKSANPRSSEVFGILE